MRTFNSTNSHMVEYEPGAYYFLMRKHQSTYKSLSQVLHFKLNLTGTANFHYIHEDAYRQMIFNPESQVKEIHSRYFKKNMTVGTNSNAIVRVPKDFTVIPCPADIHPMVLEELSALLHGKLKNRDTERINTLLREMGSELNVK